MIKNKYMWFDQERAGQGSTSPLRDAGSLLKEHNPTLLSVSDVFSSFDPKNLTGDKSWGEMPEKRQHEQGSPLARLRGLPAGRLAVVPNCLLCQRADAMTEWLLSLAACMPLNASEAGMSQACGDSGVPAACCQP